MQTIWGKSVRDSVDELVNPSSTALVVVDMQNDCCHEDGYFGRAGKDLRPIRGAVAAMATLVDAAREAGVLVVWIKMTLLPEARAESPAWLRRRTIPYPEGVTAPEWTLADTWGHDIVEPLRPRVNEPVIIKHRSSAFIGTPLDLVLRSKRIQTVVTGGVVTQGCVESTVRSATFFDYYVVLVRDCVAGLDPLLHKASMVVQATRCDLAESRDVIAQWAKRSA